MKSTFTFGQFQNLKFVGLSKNSKWADNLFRSLKILIITLLFFVSSNSFAQTFPAVSSCTSKDLALVAATLPYTKCETCTGGSVTKALTLAIANKTGSTRTSFAFWATLVILNADGSVASSTPISKCFSTIPKNATTSYSYGDLTFQCGQSLVLTDIWEAWTDASPNSTCPTLLNSTSTINPKCGTLPMLNIVAGDDANYNVTNATCTTSGSIQVAPFGGAGGPYTVTISNVNSTTISQTKSIASGSSYTFTNLAPGIYTFGITDGNNCAPVTETRTVLSTGSVSTPTITSGAATCSAAGTSTISNYSASNTYAFTPSGPSVGAGGLISGMTAGTSYTVTSSNGSCTSTASASFSNATMLATPATPTISSAPASCSAGGTSTVSNYSGSNTYAFTPSGPSVGAGGAISGMVVGTSYTVTSNNGSCTSGSSASFSNAAMLTTPAAPTITPGAATCSAAGSSTISNYSVSNTYAFTPTGPSVGAGGLISGMIAGTSYTVTSNNGSCTSVSSASFSNAAMLTTPAAPTITPGAATCSAAGTSTISNYSSSNTYAFTPSGPTVGSGGLISGMTVGTSYTVTSNNGSCTSAASSSFSNAAMLATPGEPTVTYNAPACDAATFTVTISGVISGATYSIADKNGVNISNVSPGNTYTTSSTANFNFGNIPAGSGYRVTVTNNGCPSSASSCGTASSSLRTMQSTTLIAAPIVEEGTTIKAYPNPFNSTVKFVVHTTKAGNGSLEVYNILGQKIKTVFRGYVPAGVNNFDLNLPGQKNANLIYKFILDKKQITGKLIQLNQ